MFNHCDFSAPIPTKPTPDARQEEPVPVDVYISAELFILSSIAGETCAIEAAKRLRGVEA